MIGSYAADEPAATAFVNMTHRQMWIIETYMQFGGAVGVAIRN